MGLYRQSHKAPEPTMACSIFHFLLLQPHSLLVFKARGQTVMVSGE